MRDLQASGGIQQFAGDVHGGAGAGRAVGHGLAALRLGDQLLEIRGAGFRADNQQRRHRANQHHRLEAFHRVVAAGRPQRWADHLRTEARQQHGVAVRRRARHRFRTDGSAGAAFVLDDDISAEQRAQFMRENARQLIDRAAGRERHHDLDGFGKSRRRQQECGRAKTHRQTFHFVSPIDTVDDAMSLSGQHVSARSGGKV